MWLRSGSNVAYFSIACLETERTPKVMNCLGLRVS